MLLGSLQWRDSGLCLSGVGSHKYVVMKTCDHKDESQVLEFGSDAVRGKLMPISVPSWRMRMDRLRGAELADSLVEVRKVLQEIRTLNTSGELGKVRGSRRAVVFYVDQGTGFLAYLRWWLYAWRLAGLDTPQQAMDVVLFTHPESVARLPADCVRVTEEFDPEAAGPGQCLYRELVPLSERNAKYDSYLNSQECMFNADTSGFLLRYKLLLRADLDTFPTPALVDFWPWDIICDTHAVTNHYLHSIEDAIVDTAAAAGRNIMWEC